MVMQEYPNSGYVVNVHDLKSIFPNQEYLDLDDEALEEWLDKNWGNQYPKYTSIYRPSEEDTLDQENMVYGERYLIFHDSDLYIKTPRQVLISLSEQNIFPKLTNWSVWG